MYAYVAAATGWTYEYIGKQLTLPRLGALSRHWKIHPPTHVGVSLIAQGLGIVKGAAAPPRHPGAAPVAAANDEASQAAQFNALRATMPFRVMQLPK